MSRVFMALWPYYVTLTSARSFSPALFRFLEDNGVEIQEYPWLGSLESLPKGGPIIVRSSSVLPYSSRDLARRCEELGHFCFYDDEMVTNDDRQFTDKEEMLEELEKWLIKNHYI